MIALDIWKSESLVRRAREVTSVYVKQTKDRTIGGWDEFCAEKEIAMRIEQEAEHY